MTPRFRPTSAGRLRRLTPAIVAAVGILASSGCGGGFGSDTGSEAPVVEYRGAEVWTGDGFERRDLHVREGRFVAPTRADSVVDLDARWVIPPFGDAHSHSWGSPYTPPFPDSAMGLGVFYALDLGNPTTSGRRMADRLAADSFPDVGFAHGGISRRRGLARPHPAGGMERLYGEEGEEWGLEGDAYWSVPTVAHLDSIWPAYLDTDPDVVKVYVMLSGYGDHGCGTGLCPEVLEEVVRRAHDEDLRVFAHVNIAEDVRVALDAGVDGIAHLPLGNDGIEMEDAEFYTLDSTTIRRIGERQLVVTPTSHLVLGETERFPPDTLPEQIALQADQLQRLHEAGARLALSGHDWRVTSHREAEYLIEYGIFDPATVLDLWTRTTPSAIWPDRRIGRLAPGWEASFLVLDADPLRDVSATRRIGLAVKQGTVVGAGDAGPEQHR